MMSAEEVRKLWNEEEQRYLQKEINLVENAIKEALEKHLCEVKIYQSLDPETINTLKKNGYKIKHKLGFWGFGIDPHWKITW